MREAMGRREEKRRLTHEASLRRCKKTHVREKRQPLNSLGTVSTIVQVSRLPTGFIAESNGWLHC
jgi:hypothetical protein